MAAIGTDVPFVIQDYPLASGVQMAPSVIRRIVMRSLLQDAEARGLAGAGEDQSPSADSRQTARCGHISILTGNGGMFLDFEMERGADGAMTGYAFPDMLVDVMRLGRELASATPRTIFSMPTCRCCATSSSQASGSPFANT